jgi:hypothetical protein
MARSLAIATLFLAAQMAPGLHGLHEEELAPHCPDGTPEQHFCKCAVDHDAPPCVICAHAAVGGCTIDGCPSDADVRSREQTPVVEAGFLGSSPLPLSAAPRGPPALV